jgi:adenine-specific DNA-methyltransferase
VSGTIEASASVTSNKLRGGYYTPESVAEWLCRWAIQTSNDRVLEPSSGDGVFLGEACKRLIELGASADKALANIRGTEIIPAEVKKSRARLKEILAINPNGQIACTDFFEWAETDKVRYDCVVGNPPFIRYQSFPEPSRTTAMRMMESYGLRPNKLTNIWVPFVVAAAGRLTPGGRLALVLPAELLQVTYAAQLRVFLADHFSRIHIFSCNHLFFDKAQQEIVLLLADDYSIDARRETQCLIELRETTNIDELLAAKPNHKRLEEYSVVDHSTEKWLKYFLTPKEIGLMRALKKHRGVTALESHASIDVGVVTGRNEFFVIARDIVKQYGLKDYVTPLVGRSSQLKGAILEADEWQELADEGQKTYLLDFRSSFMEKPQLQAKRYIAMGEKEGYNTGYKCAIREPWYEVPSVWIPECFFFRQIYDFPRVAVNRACATSTDTIHRMRCKGNPDLVATNIFTHLSAASAEIEGRSYGGGVLELEPTEAERLLMPAILQKVCRSRKSMNLCEMVV